MCTRHDGLPPSLIAANNFTAQLRCQPLEGCLLVTGSEARIYNENPAKIRLRVRIALVIEAAALAR